LLLPFDKRTKSLGKRSTSKHTAKWDEASRRNRFLIASQSAAERQRFLIPENGLGASRPPAAATGPYRAA